MIKKIDEARLINSNLDGYEHTGIAVVQGGFHRLTIIDHEADCLTDLTKAMICAPELLEALENLFEQCAMVHKYWGENCNATEAQNAIDKARLIINKAKGE